MDGLTPQMVTVVLINQIQFPYSLLYLYFPICQSCIVTDCNGFQLQ